ncbi:hypothetical protein LOS11_18560 [Proteus mirabilis]|uniref:glycosyltransferase family 32 protein n=1 Tax=Proteus mirabilis TaxID=584 RepID=UPI001E5EFFE5|nr:glycosyltransferase [Proteus mirabilis]MCD4600035.1 hypothetical protein [Proteus mirabilis]
MIVGEDVWFILQSLYLGKYTCVNEHLYNYYHISTSIMNKKWKVNNYLDEINCSYLSEAYSNEKWAFVSDVIRLYALYINGGIYLDTDVEVIDSFDEFLTLDFFSCHEYHEGNCWPITSAVMGACKENHIIKDLLELYMTLRFETKEGLDLTANTQRITEYFKTKFSLSPPFY